MGDLIPLYLSCLRCEKVLENSLTSELSPGFLESALPDSLPAL